ncbi:hypothetical protein [Streptomyces sp. NPDC057910]|uniref:hypothetical protein n=1 Tax=Streptomyces sp. NPDC057910 TaxID=3346278 RepID=UPI0036E9F379
MPDSTTLQSHYADQVQSDLASNVEERERITAQISELQEQLQILEGNHGLLTAMQQALGTSTPAASLPKKTREPAAAKVPRPHASAEPSRTEAKKQNQDAAGTRTRGNGPTLRELVTRQLAALRQPASAAEVTTALVDAHPGRNTAATVVRNTLENLVSKGRAERSRQGRAVFYSLTTAGTGKSAETPDPAPGGTAATTAAQATA